MEECLSWQNIIKDKLKDQDIWTKKNKGRISIPIGIEDQSSTGDLVYYDIGCHNTDNNILLVGEPAAGTHMFVDTIILSVAREYHPKDLKFWMLDCDSTEFQKYQRTPERLNILPHMQACACSFDVKYIISYLKGLCDEVKRRQELLKDAGNYDNYIYQRKKNPEEFEDISMILFVCLDLNKVYNKADKYNKARIETYTRYLFKEGYRVGLHQLHVSRYAEEDIPDFIMDNCNVRMCKFIKKEYREKVLRKQDTYGEDNYHCRVFATNIHNAKLYYCWHAFIPYDEFWQEINMLYNKYRTEVGEVERPYEYNEVREAMYSEQWDAYYDLGNMGSNKGTIILGPCMLYSKNQVPENVVFDSENCLHMLAVLNQENDLINFFKTVMHGINHNSSMDGPKVLINSQDKKLNTLCDIQHTGVRQEVLGFADSETSPRQVIEICKSIIKLRSFEEEELEPIYIVLIGWENGLGFGIRRSDETVNELYQLMKKCGEYNMHFIFISRSIEAFPEEIISLTECRISSWVDTDTSIKLFGNKLGTERIGCLNEGVVHIVNCGTISAYKLYEHDNNSNLPKSSVE